MEGKWHLSKNVDDILNVCDVLSLLQSHGQGYATLGLILVDCPVVLDYTMQYRYSHGLAPGLEWYRGVGSGEWGQGVEGARFKEIGNREESRKQLELHFEAK